MFRRLSVILILIIAAVALFGSVIPMTLKQALYTISVNMKDLIVLFLPIIVFGLLFKQACAIPQAVDKNGLIVMTLAAASSFAAVIFGRFAGNIIYGLPWDAVSSGVQKKSLTYFWELRIPRLLSSNLAIFLGGISGVALSRLYPSKASRAAAKLDDISGTLFKYIMRMIPVFIAGFLIKMQYDGDAYIIFQEYIAIFFLIICVHVVYISVFYLIVFKFNIIACINRVKYVIKAGSDNLDIVADANKPLVNQGIGKGISAAMSIHMLGDCLTISVLAYAVLRNFGMPEPGFFQHIMFAFYFVIMRFSVPNVPAGGNVVIVMPALEDRLGLDAAMLSLVIALYILLDPVIARANTIGNGAFAKLTVIAMDKLERKKKA